MTKFLLAIPLLAATFVPSAAAGASRQTSPQRDGAPNFVSVCRYSPRAPDDPIVRPRQPGSSHSHDFFANTTTNAFSTDESLRAAGTTCREQGDTAGYWVPTLLDNGQPVTPILMRAYYTRGGKRDGTITPFPAGLKVVAGDAKATAPQPTKVESWGCGPASGDNNEPSPPACASGERLRLHVRFPDCWDGKNLDSADHKSHLAYSQRGRCDAAHPVQVPKLSENVVYPISDGSHVTLSSGPAYTAHGDFFNAWDQQRLAHFVDVCLNARVHCGAVR